MLIWGLNISYFNIGSLNMFYKLSRFIYSLFDNNHFGLYCLVLSGVLILPHQFGSEERITDKSQLDWDYGYLENIGFSKRKRKSKRFVAIYSKKYNKKRYFGTNIVMNTSYLKKKIIEDPYYDREIKIGSTSSWMNGLYGAPTAGMMTYEIQYRGDIVLSFEKSSALYKKRGKQIFFIMNLIWFIINFPYFYYLLLLLGVKLYSRCK